jgi:hypothetical protein
VSESEVVRQAIGRIMEDEADIVNASKSSEVHLISSDDTTSRKPGLDKGKVVIAPDFDAPL